MSDDTLLSRIRELEAENAELRKTSKADIDARAERIEMRCSECKFYGKISDGDGMCAWHKDSLVYCFSYCKSWIKNDTQAT